MSRIEESLINRVKRNDHVANLTSWEPIPTSTANFNTRKISTKRENRISFVPTYSSILFSLFFIAMGLGLSDLGDLSDPVDLSFISLAPLVFVAGGSVMLFFDYSPIFFDSKDKVFRKGRSIFRKRVGFSDIYSLQLLLARTNSDNGCYWNYQMNIVFKDGKRQHVVTWNDKVQASMDAEEIARMVGVELWNTIVEPEYKTEPERTILGIVHKNDVGGKRKLKDWQSMPLLMKAGFIATDSHHAHFAWFFILFFSFCGLAFHRIAELFETNIVTGEESAGSLAVGIFFVVSFVASGIVFFFFFIYLGHVFRALNNMWYENWRRSLNK